MDNKAAVRAARVEFDNMVGPVLLVTPPGNPFEYVDTYIGQMKLAETLSLVNIARFALWSAYRTDHESENPRTILWIRAGYWSNAVVWLNSCEDLACQTVWFTLNLHRRPKRSTGWYETALKKCKYENVLKQLEATNTIHSMLSDYHDNTEVGKLRNWANRLKHHGAYDWEGLDRFRPIGYLPFIDENGERVGNIRDVHPPRMNLEEAIGVAARVHQMLVQHAFTIRDALSLHVDL